MVKKMRLAEPKKLQRRLEVKKGRKWVPWESDPITNPSDVYATFASDLVAYYFENSPRIVGVERSDNLDGTMDYGVIYRDGRRAVYTVEI